MPWAQTARSVGVQSWWTSTVLFAMVPESRINSWVSWFIFNLRKISIDQYYESEDLSAGVVTRYVNTWKYKMARNDNYCTYLNWGLLEALRKYILHGLVPGLNWTPFCLTLWACILLPSLAQYLAVYCNGSSFTPSAPLLSGWLLTNVQAHITTTLKRHILHIYIYIYTSQ